MFVKSFLIIGLSGRLFSRIEFQAGLNHAEARLVAFFGKVEVTFVTAGREQQSRCRCKNTPYFISKTFFIITNVARFGILNKNHTKSHDDRKRIHPHERRIV